MNCSRSVTLAPSTIATNGSPTRFCESVNVMPSQPASSAARDNTSASPVSGMLIV